MCSAGGWRDPVLPLLHPLDSLRTLLSGPGRPPAEYSAERFLLLAYHRCRDHGAGNPFDRYPPPSSCGPRAHEGSAAGVRRCNLGDRCDKERCSLRRRTRSASSCTTLCWCPFARDPPCNGRQCLPEVAWRGRAIGRKSTYGCLEFPFPAGNTNRWGKSATTAAGLKSQGEGSQDLENMMVVSAEGTGLGVSTIS